MAVGKNKLASKGGKKGSKRKAVDPFLKKEWYDIKAPTMFTQRQVGKTLITRTQGTKIASEGLKGRVFEVSLADLQKDEDNAFRKIRLRVEEVQGRSCLTNFHGMTFTTDKLRSLVRKWQTLIEAYADVKTSDGYTIRLFCISFTKKRLGQVAKCCYCQSSQEKAIRRKMVEVMHREAECPMHELVSKFIPESIGREIEKECHTIYPLQNTYIRKAKLLRTPRFDITKLMELHAGNEAAAGAAAGERVDRPEGGLIPEAEERVEIEGDY